MPFINDHRQLSLSWRYGPVDGEVDSYTNQSLYSVVRVSDENDFFIGLSLKVDMIGSQRYQWWKRQTWHGKLKDTGAEALRREVDDYLQQPWWRQLLKRTFTDITKKQRLLAYNELYQFKKRYKAVFANKDRNDKEQRDTARRQALTVVNNFQQRNPYDSDSNILNYHQLNDHQKNSFDDVTKKISKEKVRLQKIVYPDTPSSNEQFTRPASSYPQPQATKKLQTTKQSGNSLKNLISTWFKQTAQLLGFFNLYQAQNQPRQSAGQRSSAVDSNSSGRNQTELERENRRLKTANEQFKAEIERLKAEKQQLKAKKERLEAENKRLEAENEQLTTQVETFKKWQEEETADNACNTETPENSQNGNGPELSSWQTRSGSKARDTLQSKPRRFSVSESDLWRHEPVSEENRGRSLSL